MKKVIKLLALLVTSFIIFEIIVNNFTKSYKNIYKVYNDDKIFEITEQYQKEDNYYDIEININNKVFNYTVYNDFNKQKRIVNKVLYFENNDDMCIYPILEYNKESYIECNSNDSLYVASSYPNKDFITTITNELKEKKYLSDNDIDLKKTDTLKNSTFYKNNINKDDILALWQYKGIDIFNSKEVLEKLPLKFDKYENKTGYLAGKYYVLPVYNKKRVLEFSSVYIIDLTIAKLEKINLEYTMSSDTYINGVVDNKLYYTDPSNLLQIEINPKDKKYRLIGSEKLGGQMYDGTWKDRNIYDFKTNQIKYTNLDKISNYNYKYAGIGDSSYYYVDDNNNVYQIPKLHLDKKILLFNNNLNNFNVVGDDIYYINNDTVYYYNIKKGIAPILVNQDLIYNPHNRISIYRNK